MFRLTFLPNIHYMYVHVSTIYLQSLPWYLFLVILSALLSLDCVQYILVQCTRVVYLEYPNFFFVKHFFILVSIAKFTSCSCSAAIHELNVYTVESDKLIARNTQVSSSRLINSLHLPLSFYAYRLKRLICFIPWSYL